MVLHYIVLCFMRRRTGCFLNRVRVEALLWLGLESGLVGLVWGSVPGLGSGAPSLEALARAVLKDVIPGELNSDSVRKSTRSCGRLLAPPDKGHLFTEGHPNQHRDTRKVL